MNLHKFKVDVEKVNKNCILCKEKITDEEFNYEDYFIVFRGMGEETIRGFACFNCITKPKISGLYNDKGLTFEKYKKIMEPKVY